MAYQLHAAFIVVLDMLAMFVVIFLVTLLLLTVGSFVKRIWQNWRRKARFDYEVYAAARDIKDIGRRAIHDLLAAEQEYRDIGGGGDVIEGTAVEVRR